MSISRRIFLKSALAAGMYTSAPVLWKLGMSNALAADSGEYRATVCVYLHGGNDGFNCFIPVDNARYTEYARARRELAYARERLLPVQTRSLLVPYGFHPQLPGLRNLFLQGRVAVLANVGTLRRPITRDQFTGQTAPVPNKLFSHFDQQRLWQAPQPANMPEQGPGWGGRMADSLSALNGAARFPSVTTVAETSDYCAGVSTRPAAVNALRIDGLAGANTAVGNVRASAMRQLAEQQIGHPLVDSAAVRTGRMMDEYEFATSALAAYPGLQTAFPATPIGMQFKRVAQMIQARDSFGITRQVFFVSLGGFDTHFNQLVGQAAALSQLDAAMSAFYRATEELGVAQQVLSFTMSEFGRTISPASDGSDHGWGNNHFVMGGAVRGGEVYGNFPSLTLGGPDDAGDKGRLIPTTSVDQYAATIATWMGVSAASVSAMFPDLVNFSSQRLAFV